MIWKCLLKKAPEGIRRGIGPVGGPQGQEPVSIHGLQSHGDRLGSRCLHPGEEKGGKVVGDHHAGVFCQRRKQPFSPIDFRFNVGVVVYKWTVLQLPGVVRHPRDDEIMEPVAGPGVAGAEGFQDHDGFVEPDGHFHSPLKAEVEPNPTAGDYPVENVASLFVYGRLVGFSDADGGNIVHGRLFWGEKEIRL